MNFSNNDYFLMDRYGGGAVIEPMVKEDENAVREALNFTTADIGTTTNPMANTLQSVKSRIMEGAGRLEFEFIGKGKGNSQSPTPESFGTPERTDMKELLTINNIHASVHAAVHGESLAGFGRGGFTGAQREEALREIKRAIDFAGDVTHGGAVVFHLSEWQRPLTYAGKRTMESEHKWMFKGYDSEEKDSVLYLVDKRTGKFIEDIQKDKEVYEPVYRTVVDDDRTSRMVGKMVRVKTGEDEKGNPVYANHVVAKDDWVTVTGQVIPKFTKDIDLLFERMPEWNTDKTNFKVHKLDWNEFVRRAEDWNKNNPDDQVTPEKLFARTEFENQVLQHKGSSLYHARSYDDLLDRQSKLLKAIDLYKAYENDLPPEALERIKELVPEGKFIVGERKLPTEILTDELKKINNDMRHIHESSAAADARAQQFSDVIKNMQTAEEYGLQKTAESIASVGMMAMEETRRKKLKDPLYAAPENYDQHLYGSHPTEMRKIIEESRKKMAENILREKRAGSQEEALRMAKEHIKGTLDIGHMNMWRQYFDPVDSKGNAIYKTFEEREKAFEKWLMTETEKLVKDGIVGHIHLTDNFGYGDEHVTPGQGNVPMKEFMKRLQKHGMKDIIVEPGSYNAITSFPDTLSLIGSPIYGVGRLPRFNQVQQRHFGYNAPGFFIAGAYVPSNDWRPWTEVPLE
jgi:sugar phosphate isomerase/epimerase